MTSVIKAWLSVTNDVSLVVCECDRCDVNLVVSDQRDISLVVCDPCDVSLVVCDQCDVSLVVCASVM